MSFDIEPEPGPHDECHNEITKLNRKLKIAKSALERCAQEESNSYKIDELVNQLFELSKKHGGYQNCYAINVIRDGRLLAAGALKEINS